MSASKSDDVAQFPKCLTNLCTCRRRYLSRLLQSRNGTKLISTSASPILGTPNSMTSQNDKLRRYIEKSYQRGIEERNKHTH